jgi:hypothetical protein
MRASPLSAHAVAPAQHTSNPQARDTRSERSGVESIQEAHMTVRVVEYADYL